MPPRTGQVVWGLGSAAQRPPAMKAVRARASITALIIFTALSLGECATRAGLNSLSLSRRSLPMINPRAFHNTPSFVYNYVQMPRLSRITPGEIRLNQEFY